MSAVAAALVEAWSEVRVHRVRFVLSLVGVFLAVFAMTTITALGDMGRQLIVESVERSGGRAATLQVQVFGGDQAPPDPADLRAEYADVVDRYRIGWASTTLFTEVVAAFPEGTRRVPTQVVDPAYGELHRIVPVLGRWFTETDDELLAPAVVVNRTMLQSLGPRDPALPPTVVLGGVPGVRATVVGVLDDPGFEPQLFLLPGAHERWLAEPATTGSSLPSLEVWVPPEQADAVQQAVESDLAAVYGAGAVSIFRSDAAGELEVLDLALDYGVRAVGAFALLLGGIGVLNVGLVTVRQRIREIGVRRSFGATSARVFATVLLESVCATAFAGAAAVALSVALVENIPFELLLGDGLTLTDVPPFPARAALEGFLAATAVGALAGFLPAVMAVRSRVIDAIRY